MRKIASNTNGLRTQKRLVRKRTLNYLAKIAKFGQFG